MKGYQGSRSDILKALKVKEELGLSTYEVENRIKSFGKNELEEKKKDSIFILFIRQFLDPMVLILCGASLLSMLMREWMDASIILFVMVLNAFVGTLQEYKAEKALEALKKLSSFKSKVKRDGGFKEVESSSLVIGDIVSLKAGDYIPADMRLLQATSLQVDESILSGESEAQVKNEEAMFYKECQIHEQTNMVFMSCYVTSGHALGVVCVSAKESEVGKVAFLLTQEEKEKTPLQIRLTHLSTILGIGALVICAMMFLLYRLQGRDFMEILLLSISLAVAAIPEGLMAVVTIVLALGVSTMSKQNAIVRRLHCVETLGCVSVICCDKTGTLTQNQMKVEEVWDATFQNKASTIMLEVMALCNNVDFQGKDVLGEATEKALVIYANKLGYEKKLLEIKKKRIKEIPFDSKRKCMSVLYRQYESYYVYCKGASEILLEKCTYYQKEEEILLLTMAKREEIKYQVQQLSLKSLRVLALAYKKVHNIQEDIERNLVFVGLVALLDPPREEVYKSIQQCYKAGIKVNMITGDNTLTAYAIAKKLDIAKTQKEVISGKEMAKMSDAQLAQSIHNYHVFARVTPQDKVRIVTALKSQKEVVAMSGDGVNDAPALKRADIGVAMGKNGSDVCKQCSDMILVDDNFNTIVKAVEEGRNIYLNIQKAILYLLSCNLGEIMALFLVSVFMPHVVSTLSAVQILWVNLVTDSLPALALGIDPKDAFLMEEKPRNRKESLFGEGGIAFTLLNGMLIGTMSIVAFRYGLNTSALMAQTMAFMVLSISQLLHALNLTSRTHSIFEVGIFKNRWLILTIVFGIVLQICVVSLPFFQILLNTQSLDKLHFLLVFVLSSMPIVVNEASKWIAKEVKKY